MFDKKKQNKPENESLDDDIQDEIRRRILKESRRKDGKRSFEESTRATLDALKDMVPLSREEMEKIAEQVKNEFSQKNTPEKKRKSRGWIFPWTGLILMILTFFLARRGSSWYLFTALILIFVLLNYFWRKSSEKDDENS